MFNKNEWLKWAQNTQQSNADMKGFRGEYWRNNNPLMNRLYEDTESETETSNKDSSKLNPGDLPQKKGKKTSLFKRLTKSELGNVGQQAIAWTAASQALSLLSPSERRARKDQQRFSPSRVGTQQPQESVEVDEATKAEKKKRTLQNRTALAYARQKTELESGKKTAKYNRLANQLDKLRRTKNNESVELDENPFLRAFSGVIKGGKGKAPKTGIHKTTLTDPTRPPGAPKSWSKNYTYGGQTYTNTQPPGPAIGTKLGRGPERQVSHNQVHDVLQRARHKSYYDYDKNVRPKTPEEIRTSNIKNVGLENPKIASHISNGWKVDIKNVGKVLPIFTLASAASSLSGRKKSDTTQQPDQRESVNEIAPLAIAGIASLAAPLLMGKKKPRPTINPRVKSVSPRSSRPSPIGEVAPAFTAALAALGKGVATGAGLSIGSAGVDALIPKKKELKPAVSTAPTPQVASDVVYKKNVVTPKPVRYLAASYERSIENQEQLDEILGALIRGGIALAKSTKSLVGKKPVIKPGKMQYHSGTTIPKGRVGAPPTPSVKFKPKTSPVSTKYTGPDPRLPLKKGLGTKVGELAKKAGKGAIQYAKKLPGEVGKNIPTALAFSAPSMLMGKPKEPRPTAVSTAPPSH